MTAQTIKTVKCYKNKRKNDPVSRFQELALGWKKDKFLTTGGSRK